MTAARLLPLRVFWIPPHTTVAVRDAGRWLIVRHDGAETAPIEWDAEGFFHPAPGIAWSVATSATIPPNTEVVEGA